MQHWRHKIWSALSALLAGAILLLTAGCTAPQRTTASASLTTPVIPPGGMGPGSKIISAARIATPTPTPKPAATLSATPHPPPTSTPLSPEFSPTPIPPRPTTTPHPPTPVPKSVIPARPTISAQPTPVRAYKAPSLTIINGVRYFRYRVVAHDTLYSISRRYHVPLIILKEVNGIKNINFLKIGTILLIPIVTPTPTHRG